MKKLILICLLFFTVSFCFSQRIFVSDNKYSFDIIKVFVTKNQNEADIWVFKTQDKYKVKSNSNIASGIWFFTQDQFDYDFKLFFVSDKFQADLIVYFTKYKEEAGKRK